MVNARARIGAGVIVNSGSIVEHDVQVGAFSHLAPASLLLGECRIGEETLVGGGSVVLPGVSVGNRATIAAGGVAVHEIVDGSVVRGVPARRD